jgi:hypothetical protein
METRNPKELAPHPVHASIYQVGDTRSLELDITENGLKHPIEITPEGLIIAGRRRTVACINIGMTQMPVRVFDLPEDKVLNHMVSDNLYRVKTWDEVYNEIAHKRIEVGKKQGARTDQTEEQKKINTRRQVAEGLGIKENVVRVLELIGDKPEHREILARDTENNTVNALEETYKRRLAVSEEQYDDEFPVVDLRPKRCCTCGGVPPRIISDYVNNTLSYESDKDHCNYM